MEIRIIVRLAKFWSFVQNWHFLYDFLILSENFKQNGTAFLYTNTDFEVFPDFSTVEWLREKGLKKVFTCLSLEPKGACRKAGYMSHKRLRRDYTCLISNNYRKVKYLIPTPENQNLFERNTAGAR